MNDVMPFPDAGTLALFMTAALALNVTPGPDMLYVVARSVGEGRSAGIISSFGTAAGSLVHTLAVALGLAGLLRAVPVAFDIVTWMGGAIFRQGMRLGGGRRAMGGAPVHLRVLRAIRNRLSHHRHATHASSSRRISSSCAIPGWPKRFAAAMPR